MANIQEVQTLTDTDKRLAIKCVRLNDGTGDDSDLVIVDCNAIINEFEGFDILLTLVKAMWCVGGPSADKTVVLEWEGSGDNKILLTLSGNDDWDLGTPITNNASDPTGNVLLTTTNFDAGDSYTIILEFRKTAGTVDTEQTSSSSSSSSS